MASESEESLSDGGVHCIIIYMIKTSHMKMHIATTAQEFTHLKMLILVIVASVNVSNKIEILRSGPS